MSLSTLDLATFVGFLAVVISVSLYASRREDTTEDYFLAGRSLTWWLIGTSLIASNISTEHFVGMAGKGYGLGLAIASYEWMAAITLVLVGWFFLPRFLKLGIFTIPEYLEHRYNLAARTIMAVFMMIAYIVVALATVLYSGALAMNAVFGLDITLGVWMIGILAGAYTIYGGLKAVVWSDLLQGVTLLVGGIVVTVVGFSAVGGPAAFFAANADKLHTVLPWNHPEMPWVAVFIGGLWIPNTFYWGLNQFITQRTLGAKNLGEAQRGIVLAAALKLLIPFIIVFPGIMAHQLYGGSIANPDQAYPLMIQNILPAGLRGVMFAALFGAVMSSLDSMINSASTIFTIDLYRRHWSPDATSRRLVRVGRIATAAFVLIGCSWAPALAGFGSVFDYIQMFWGFITPAIVAVFVWGMAWKRVSPLAANTALVLGVPIYGLLLTALPNVAFLHHMGITFLLLSAVIVTITMVRPLPEPHRLEARFELADGEVRIERSVLVAGIAVIMATVALYIVFW